MVKGRDQLIAERVSLSRRYVRSTDVARDLNDPLALDGYVLTASARDALERLSAGLADASTQRAFRITGPYGSGKSSFAVLLCGLALADGREAAASLVKSAGHSAAAELSPCDVLVLSGRRSSFARDLLAAVAHRAQEGGVSAVAAQAAAAADVDGPGLVARAAIDALDALARATSAASGRRTLLVVDEMGRYVEYAASHPRSEDPSIFQQLAERAGGSSGPPLAVVGVLHHRFAEYVAGLGGLAEAEWTRSAERYEEIPFCDSLEQSLHLVAGALRARPAHTRAVTRTAEAAYASATDHGLLSGGPEDAVRIAPELYPLHPAALAGLAIAARRLGQNERSIFGFLQTLEPMGFQRFAQETRYGPDAWYRLPQLFDYFVAQGALRFGSADRERRWHLALDAIAQVEPESLEGGVIRCVALIAVLEPFQGMRATPASLAWCLDIAEVDVIQALEALGSKGLVYRRPQSGDYSLWSRSSVDLDHWLEEARICVPATDRLDQAIAILPAPRPLVAHAHYQRTGTLRAFAVALRSALDDAPVTIPAGYDGVVAIMASHPQDDAADVQARAAHLSKGAGRRALVHVHRVSTSDLQWANRLRQWRWVQEQCPELRVDDLARAEVGSRVAQAEVALAEALASLAAPMDDGWLQDGEPVTIVGRAALSRRMSLTCDDAFNASPILRNELINRSKLSTAVASARMRLLETMLDCESEPMLGLTGAPPERTIHLAMFHASGMHAEVAPGVWAFGPPDAAHDLRWRTVWDRLGNILEGGAPVSFVTIAEQLAQAPWGLRAGPSLLLIAAYMLHNRAQVALMERNSFVPELTAAHFMRLAKNPANFALRAMGGGDERTRVLERLSASLPLPSGIARPAAEVKSIVEALYRWFGRLSDSARQTEKASKLAKAVRIAVAKARDPMDLLFDQLPRACGSLDVDGRIDADTFVENLAAAMDELADVDPTLRRLASAALASSFGQKDPAAVRDRLANDFQGLRGELTDYPLRQFVDRALGGETADDRWLDGIAGLVAGRRIENWDDGSLDTFSFKVRETAGRLSRWLFLKQRADARKTEMVSLHLLTTSGEERAVVVDGGHVDAMQVEQVRRALQAADHPERILAELLGELMDARNAKVNV